MALYIIQTYDSEAFLAYSHEAAFRTLKEYPEAHRVLGVDVEAGFSQDLSLVMAERWLAEIGEEGYPASQSEFPAFIQRHISPLRLEDLMSEQETEARYERDHIRSYSGAL